MIGMDGALFFYLDPCSIARREEESTDEEKQRMIGMDGALFFYLDPCSIARREEESTDKEKQRMKRKKEHDI